MICDLLRRFAYYTGIKSTKNISYHMNGAKKKREEASSEMYELTKAVEARVIILIGKKLLCNRRVSLGKLVANLGEIRNGVGDKSPSPMMMMMMNGTSKLRTDMNSKNSKERISIMP